MIIITLLIYAVIFGTIVVGVAFLVKKFTINDKK